MDWRQAEAEYTDEVIGETTIPVAFFDAVERHGDLDCQLYKGGIYDRSLVSGDIVPAAPSGEYAAITYESVGDIVARLAAGFRALGVEADDRVSIYADTRMEWAHADMAIQTAEGVATTVYTESSPRQVKYLLEDPGSMGVVVENADLLETLGEVEGELELSFVVTLDEVPSDAAEGFDADLHTLAEVYELGSEGFDRDEVDRWLDRRDWTDLSSLVYTSGTTGDPKGVMLQHKHWRSLMNAVRKRLGPRPDKPADMPKFEAGKTSLAFLPLAHAFERSGHFQSLASGITIGYAESTDTIADDIQQVQPQLANSVPRVYERIYNGMREQASDSPVSKRIFEWAVETGKAYDEAESPGLGLRTKFALADRLVFSKVREALGGNIEMFVSGGGSLSTDLAKLYRAMGITIIEGYGLTETAPGLVFNPPEDIRVGTMGPPLHDVQLKLDRGVVSPEQKEAAEGEVGELLAKGPNVFEGYWNKPDKTEEAFTEAGWFRTGDIVARDEDDYYSFVDRRKNLIVLDTGKNVAPEPIEDEFATSARIDQVMVVGDNEKFIGAVIVPNFEQLREWADEEGIDLPDDPEAVANDERVREWIAEDVEAVNADLGKSERIKEFRLAPEEWTAENDALTPSLKKKRRVIRSRHEHLIDDIYGRTPAEADADTGAAADD
ncbi:AMP-dependent synthetase/ligase [Haloglomus litoreum]|uniref:AMP-dependent synthetase/ligase n=1 Tax=Haloglomus litoreum TaxID=3034026 RepID=UPI0023E75E84|nr:long-chain fatty acid--CoA ligase [Haloglomus sp. DT116]